MTDKIDKRTKEYRDSQSSEGRITVEVTDTGNTNITETIPPGEVEETLPVDDFASDGTQLDQVVRKLDKLLSLVNEIYEHITHPRLGIVPEPEAPVVEKEPTKPIDFTKCMKCGEDLPPTETPRRVQELCNACVWRNSKKVG